MFELAEDAETSPCSQAATPSRAAKSDTGTPKVVVDEDWEFGLDSFGVAKCGVCGMKLPLEKEEIEKHCLECEEAQREGREVTFSRSKDSSVPARAVEFLPASGARPLKDRAALLREKLSA